MWNMNCSDTSEKVCCRSMNLNHIIWQLCWTHPKAVPVAHLNLTIKHSTMLLVLSPLHGPLSFLPLLSPQVVFLLVLRLRIQGGHLPPFTPHDNPASFSSSILTRTLTFHFLAAFNSELLLAPITLSYDWQMGSIPLVEAVEDPRNAKTAFLCLVLGGLLFRSLWQVKKVIYALQLACTKCCWSLAMCFICLPWAVQQFGEDIYVRIWY